MGLYSSRCSFVCKVAGSAEEVAVPVAPAAPVVGSAVDTAVPEAPAAPAAPAASAVLLLLVRVGFEVDEVISSHH